MSKDFTDWHKLKTDIEKKQRKLFFHPREVWWCSLGLNVGFEEDGKGRLYERPALILKVFSNEALLILPFTSVNKAGPYYHALEDKGSKTSVILSQVRLISPKRLSRKIRTISKADFIEVMVDFEKNVLNIKNDPLTGVSEAEAIYNQSIAENKSLSSNVLSSKKKLSVEPYKGTRDFYPEEQFVQNYIFGVWKKVVESFGYLEYNASILEETDLYRAKSGEEIINEQTYSFTDRGGRDVTIRPEMTPTVARMVAQKRRELSFPLRWYSIPNLFRYERPQRGRLREHWQLNVDIFGVDGIDADVETVAVAHGIMKAFGAKDDSFEIHLNSRRLMNFVMEDFIKATSEQSHKASKLIDKMNKMEGSEFSKAMTEILGEKSGKLLEVLKVKKLDQLDSKILESVGGQELTAAFSKLENLGIKNFVFDPAIVRGFDYYTGMVFEMYDTNPKNPRAIFGGGRYDDLVGIFGVEKVSGVGFGWGDVTTRDFLETYDLLPKYTSPVQLYICHLDGNMEDANKLASELRAQGIKVEVDLTNRKVTQQVKTADRESIPYVLVVGDDEVKSGKFKVKNLKDSKEVEVLKADISKHFN